LKLLNVKKLKLKFEIIYFVAHYFIFLQTYVQVLNVLYREKCNVNTQEKDPKMFLAQCFRILQTAHVIILMRMG
jgi:hypothetical protein